MTVVTNMHSSLLWPHYGKNQGALVKTFYSHSLEKNSVDVNDILEPAQLVLRPQSCTKVHHSKSVMHVQPIVVMNLPLS